MIKAVIFDMDGLLIDSEPLWEEVEVEVFNRVGVPLTKERTRETMGLKVDEVINYWYTKYPWKNPSKEKITEEIVKGVIRLVKEKGEACEGASEIINLFKDKNMPMAIASSSPLLLIDAVLNKLNIRDYIGVIASAENEKFGKPNPAVYLTTAKKLNLDPEECLVFEDSPNGVMSAKAAGMKCIAVPSSKVKGDPKFNLADKIINSLKDFQPSDLVNL